MAASTYSTMDRIPPIAVLAIAVAKLGGELKLSIDDIEDVMRDPHALINQFEVNDYPGMIWRSTRKLDRFKPKPASAPNEVSVTWVDPAETSNPYPPGVKIPTADGVAAHPPKAIEIDTNSREFEAGGHTFNITVRSPQYPSLIFAPSDVAAGFLLATAAALVMKFFGVL